MLFGIISMHNANRKIIETVLPTSNFKLLSRNNDINIKLKFLWLQSLFEIMKMESENLKNGENFKILLIF